MSSSPPTDPFDWAGKILSRRDHSEAELRQKMKAKGFETEAIDRACLRLHELGWLDDSRFAKAFARDLLEVRRLGHYAAKAKMRAKGLDHGLIEKTLTALSDSSAEQARIREWIERRSRGLNESDPRKRKQKLFRFLAGKGFDSEAIRDAIEEMIGNNDDE